VFAKNFRVNAVMKTSVLLSWEVPDSYKSAVPFKVRVGCREQGAGNEQVWEKQHLDVLHGVFRPSDKRPAEQGQIAHRYGVLWSSDLQAQVS